MSFGTQLSGSHNPRKGMEGKIINTSGKLSLEEISEMMPETMTREPFFIKTNQFYAETQMEFCGMLNDRCVAFVDTF